MPQTAYTAAIDKRIADIKGAWKATRNIAIEKTIEFMQTPVAQGGNMPVDTGFLRASLQFAIGQGPRSLTDNPGGGSFTYNPGDLTLVLLQAEPSDPIEAVYTAKYSSHVEYGTRGRPGRRFVALAAQNWVRNVEQAASEVMSRIN